MNFYNISKDGYNDHKETLIQNSSMRHNWSPVSYLLYTWSNPKEILSNKGECVFPVSIWVLPLSFTWNKRMQVNLFFHYINNKQETYSYIDGRQWVTLHFFLTKSIFVCKFNPIKYLSNTILLCFLFFVSVI